MQFGVGIYTIILYTIERLIVVFQPLTEYSKSIETFGKLKVPTRNSMFYLAASLIKNNELEKAKETLKQAILISNLSTENFIKTQSYQKSEQIAELEDVLKMIELK